MRNATQRPAPAAQPAQSRTSNRPPAPRRTVTERSTEPVAASAPASSAVRDPFNGRSFNLNFVSAEDDIPRVIRAFVKMGKMECGLVLLPHEGQGILVHSQEGQWWKWGGTRSDIPLRPSEQTTHETAFVQLKQAQSSTSAKAHSTLRGKWSGKIACEQGQPKISLQRPVASYGTLHIWSDAVAQVWRWQVVRAEKWFSTPGQREGNAASLLVAIQQGLASAMGLLGEACSIRDSRRRAAMDTVYAEAHPLKPSKESKDPLERLQPKAEKPAKTAPTRGRTASPSAAEPALPSPTPVAQKASRRKPSPPANSPLPVPAPEATPDAGDIDPAKDKLLMDAFGAAIAQAMGKMS